jgi:hypothetical protein
MDSRGKNENCGARTGPSTVGREVRRSGSVRFRKHRRPCGQPAVVGEIGRFRPLPPQAGHFIRIKATPSDLPFKSTGFAIYPEPPHFGQSSGATLSPLVLSRFSSRTASNERKIILRYESRTNLRNQRPRDGRAIRWNQRPKESGNLGGRRCSRACNRNRNHVGPQPDPV